MEDLKKTKSKKKTCKEDENCFSYFLVKTKGYKKQFTNEDAARRKFAKLEKEKTEAQEPFKIELFAKPNLKSEWTELDFVQISDFE